jgi:hypothetical protein
VEASNRQERFEKFIADICYDRGVPIPSSEREQFELWESIATADTIHKQGPHFKMMRWFSFEDVSEFWHKDIAATRMILEFLSGTDLDGAEAAVGDIAEGLKNDVRKELQIFRQAAGSTPAFTARLLSRTNTVNMRIIMVVCRPLWSAHAERLAETTGPALTPCGHRLELMFKQQYTQGSMLRSCIEAPRQPRNKSHEHQAQCLAVGVRGGRMLRLQGSDKKDAGG